MPGFMAVSARMSTEPAFRSSPLTDRARTKGCSRDGCRKEKPAHLPVPVCKGCRAIHAIAAQNPVRKVIAPTVRAS